MANPSKKEKLVCIKSMYKNGLKTGLKKGKAYEVEKTIDGSWLIAKCDDGIQRLFSKDVFQSIGECREKRLGQLGI